MEDIIAFSPQECPTPNRYAGWLCLFAAIALHIAMIFPMMNVSTNPMDEGMVLVYPELLSKGMLAQRDFESLYPPGNIWFLAAAYKTYGTDINVERTVGLFYQILLISAIFFLFRARGLAVATVGALISSILLMRLGTVAFAWIGGLAWGVWSLTALSQPGDPRKRAIWAGVLAGLSVTWRADIAPALILAIGGYCFLAKWRWRDFLWLILAGCVSLIPLLVHALIAGPAIFFDNVLYTPIFRTHDGRSLPLNFSKAYTGQLYALMIIGTVAALTVGWAVRRLSTAQGPALLACGLFAIGILPQALQREDFAHLTFVAAFSVPLLALTLSFLTRSRLMPPLLLCTLIISLPQSVQNFRTMHSKDFGTYWVMNSGRMIGTADPGEQRVVDYLQANSKPNQSLFVGAKDLRYAYGNDVDFYHLFPSLRPATYYIEINPLSANRPNSRLAGELAKADWAFLDSSWDHSNEPNESAVPGSNAPNEVIAKKFKLVYSAEPFTLYRRIAD